MLFIYEAIGKDGNKKSGTIDAVNVDVAINALQRRGLVISSIKSEEEKGSIFEMKITWFERVSNKEVVMLSRQLATLFEAQVSALKIFRMIGGESPNPLLKKTLEEVSNDLQGGSTISNALSKHPKVFSTFYVNMVKSGEESGKLDQVFGYLADYLDRNYALVSKAKNALVYPAFVIFVFIVVMLFMFTTIIPNITAVLTQSGVELPIYTKVIIMISDFLIGYGYLLAIAVVVAGIFFYRYAKTPEGASELGKLRLSIPYLGDLYSKLYLSRLSDNMATMLGSGIPMVKVIEITGNVIDNTVFRNILVDSAEAIKSGSSVAEAFSRHEEIPSILVQMTAVGEETGQLGKILSTLAKFYAREVENAVDTLVSMIEPIMIIVLGIGVLILILSVIVPMYSLTEAI
ncbi:MAG: type II secretion system F family protein [Candidatus Paceibacterota bacterium]